MIGESGIKIFNQAHPQRERSINEQHHVHILANNNIFCGESHQERPVVTGSTGNIWKVATISPFILQSDRQGRLHGNFLYDIYGSSVVSDVVPMSEVD